MFPHRALVEMSAGEADGADILMLEDGVLEMRIELLRLDDERQDPKPDWQPVEQCAVLSPQYPY
jgi:hypothetical protein